MQVTLRASTGAKILVWLEHDSYHVRLADRSDDPRICLEMDLFEVIAELARLDLEEGAQTVEAMRLAEDAERRLRGSSGGPDAGEQPPLRLQNQR
ncbi:MAG: hypothetical protein M3Z06_03605 [Actinomycetota bacterium]|nr:hypothetical protein [Actinomycetota bacterium]